MTILATTRTWKPFILKAHHQHNSTYEGTLHIWIFQQRKNSRECKSKVQGKSVSLKLDECHYTKSKTSHFSYLISHSKIYSFTYSFIPSVSSILTMCFLHIYINIAIVRPDSMHVLPLIWVSIQIGRYIYVKYCPCGYHMSKYGHVEANGLGDLESRSSLGKPFTFSAFMKICIWDKWGTFIGVCTWDYCKSRSFS